MFGSRDVKLMAVFVMTPVFDEQIIKLSIDKLAQVSSRILQILTLFCVFRESIISHSQACPPYANALLLSLWWLNDDMKVVALEEHSTDTCHVLTGNCAKLRCVGGSRSWVVPRYSCAK